LPPHELITRDGRTVGADRLAEGGVIIFCSLACPVCLEEAEALQAAFGGGGETAYARIYMVLPSDTPSDGSWAELPWTLLLDTDNHLAEALGVSATPTHFFLDEQGRIYDVKIGFGEGTTERIRLALGR
jgi:peroxiredoxin